MEVFLFDLKADQVVASFPVSAKTPGKVEYNASRGSPGGEAMSQMISDAKSQIVKELATLTGGQFTI